MSLNLKDYRYWKIFIVQIKLSVREYIIVQRIEDEEATVFIKEATQEVAKNLKNRTEAAVKSKILTNNEDWKILLRSMLRNLRGLQELFITESL